MPPGAKLNGLTFTQWLEEWMAWAVSPPVDQSPMLDPDGSNCHVGQSKPVFFLATNFGGQDIRHCTVPAGQSIVFSPGGDFCILNLSADTEDGLRDCIEFSLSNLSTIRVEIDGVSLNLDKYRFITDPFKFTLAENNAIGLPAGEIEVVGGGYMVVHTPLPTGQHVIHIHDEFAAFGFVSDVTYIITVAAH